MYEIEIEFNIIPWSDVRYFIVVPYKKKKFTKVWDDQRELFTQKLQVWVC